MLDRNIIKLYLVVLAIIFAILDEESKITMI